MPVDLVSVEVAAAMAERAPRTVRRWISQGRLTRHEGPVPKTGGATPLLVSRPELMALLAASGQTPRDTTLPPDEAAPATPAKAPAIEIELVRLQAEVERVRLLGELETTQARLAAAERSVLRLEQLAVDLQMEAADWRERNDAREAELRAMRTTQGGSWWGRLLGGPVLTPEAVSSK